MSNPYVKCGRNSEELVLSEMMENEDFVEKVMGRLTCHSFNYLPAHIIYDAMCELKAQGKEFKLKNIISILQKNAALESFEGVAHENFLELLGTAYLREISCMREHIPMSCIEEAFEEVKDAEGFNASVKQLDLIMAKAKAGEPLTSEEVGYWHKRHPQA